MIEIKGLQKSFGDLHVLKGIDLSVKKGEVISIIGSSGSGKSTLLRCINYLEQPESGKIIMNGRDIDYSKLSKEDVSYLRSNTSMVFQNFALFKNKTALENVMEGLMIVKKKDKKEAGEIGRNLLRRVGLIDREGHYPSQLSGGQQQRVGIARALAMNPNVILLDEPTSALDPELVGEVLKVIGELAKEDITMIIVTHEMRFAEKVSDRVVYMREGVIDQIGTPEEIFKNSDNENLKRFLNSM